MIMTCFFAFLVLCGIGIVVMVFWMFMVTEKRDTHNWECYGFKSDLDQREAGIEERVKNIGDTITELQLSGQETVEENKTLRHLLACVVNEMSHNDGISHDIDFKTDSVDEIDRKMTIYYSVRKNRKLAVIFNND